MSQGSGRHNGVSELRATNCLMTTETCCNSEAGVVNMACRGGEHTSVILEGQKRWSQHSELLHDHTAYHFGMLLTEKDFRYIIEQIQT